MGSVCWLSTLSLHVGWHSAVRVLQVLHSGSLRGAHGPIMLLQGNPASDFMAGCTPPSGPGGPGGLAMARSTGDFMQGYCSRSLPLCLCHPLWRAPLCGRGFWGRGSVCAHRYVQAFLRVGRGRSGSSTAGPDAASREEGLWSHCLLYLHRVSPAMHWFTRRRVGTGSFPIPLTPSRCLSSCPGAHWPPRQECAP